MKERCKEENCDARISGGTPGWCDGPGHWNARRGESEMSVQVKASFAQALRSPVQAVALAESMRKYRVSLQAMQIDEATTDLRLASVTPVNKEELVVEEVNRREDMFKESFGDPMAPGRYGSTWRSMAMKSVFEDIVAGRWLM